MAVEASYWMDRIKKAEPAPKRPAPIRLVETRQEPRALIVAKAALMARTGITQDELYQLANERRRAAMLARRFDVAAETRPDVASAYQATMARLGKKKD